VVVQVSQSILDVRNKYASEENAKLHTTASLPEKSNNQREKNLKKKKKTGEPATEETAQPRSERIPTLSIALSRQISMGAGKNTLTHGANSNSRGHKSRKNLFKTYCKRNKNQKKFKW